MNVLNQIGGDDGVDVALREWLESITGLTAMQPSDNADIKQKHIQFSLIGMDQQQFTSNCYEYDVDNDQYRQCTIAEYMLTYQIDIMYCAEPDDIIKLLKWFRSGMYIRHGQYVNLAYSENSVVRAINWMRTNKRHYKYTCDFTFVYRCKECIDIAAIEVINIGACAEVPDAYIPDLTVNKP